MSLPKLNPIEPPWYGPVCPVVWEGRRREASPYPDLGSSQGVARTAALEKRQEGRQLAHVVGWCVQTSDCLMRLGKVRPGWKETFQLLSRAIE